MKPHFINIVFLLMLIMGCSGRPSQVMSVGKMADVIADIHVAEAALENDPVHWGTDSAKMLMKQLVCEKNGVTIDELDTSLVWYGRHLDKYTEVYQKASKMLDRKIAQAEKQGGNLQATPVMQVSADADSADLYTGIRMLRVSENSPNAVVNFFIPSDRNWERGDKLKLSVKTLGAPGTLKADMAINYTDGSVEYVNGEFGEEGRHMLYIVLDSAKSAQSVGGNIYYQLRPGLVGYVDSIAVIRTRNHDDNQSQRARYPSHLIPRR